MHDTMSRVEVITSVQRRRRWSTEEKQRIVAESARPGRTASQVARAHGILPSQLFTWRRQVLAAAVGSEGGTDGFVPVEVTRGLSAPSAGTEGAAVGGDEDRRIEIFLPDGVRLSVGKNVEAETLLRVLRTLGAR